MKTMSEKQRAFHALEGKTFPRVGMIGRYVSADPFRHREKVEVLKVTASGKTITVRFLDKHAAPEVVGDKPFRVYRRGNGCDGSGWYLPHGRSGLYGDIAFSDAMARRQR